MTAPATSKLDVSFWQGRLLAVAKAIEDVRDASVLPDNVRSELRASSYAINRAMANLDTVRVERENFAAKARNWSRA